jgi:hypothetical protein
VGESVGSQERPAERKEPIFWQGAKTFLYPIARFAAHLIIKIPLMEFQNLHFTPTIAYKIFFVKSSNFRSRAIASKFGGGDRIRAKKLETMGWKKENC